MLRNLVIPEAAVRCGFKLEGAGVLTSRTLMLPELELLLSASPRDATLEQYHEAVIGENVLMKRTVATRRESFRRLRELYALEPGLPVFRVLRHLWEADEVSRPLLACLCANARDPILRVTSGPILGAAQGEILTSDQIAQEVSSTFPGRFSPMILANIGRHAAAAWTQSRHLAGRTPKVRGRVLPTAAPVAYAIVLGHLCGIRGELLLQSYWTDLLDAPPGTLDELAFTASRYGWVDYRRIGSIADIGVSRLLA